MKTGPNVKRLIVERMSGLAVPREGGLEDMVRFLTTPGKMEEAAREAEAWVESALAAVRSAPDNHYQDDEEIAGEVLRRLEARRGPGVNR